LRELVTKRCAYRALDGDLGRGLTRVDELLPRRRAGVVLRKAIPQRQGRHFAVVGTARKTVGAAGPESDNSQARRQRRTGDRLESGHGLPPRKYVSPRASSAAHARG